MEKLFLNPLKQSFSTLTDKIHFSEANAVRSAKSKQFSISER